MISIKPLVAWYDLWIGVFWDGKKRRLYILPVPCFGIVIQFCRHKWVFIRNIYGDEINFRNGARSEWGCIECTKFQYRKELLEERKDKK